MAHEVSSTIELDAPIDKVWALLAEIEAWGEWSRMFRFVRPDARPGGRAILMARVGPVMIPLPIAFDVIERQSELRWHGGIPGALYGSHYLKLDPLPGNRTRLVHGEEFSGAVMDAGWGLVGDKLPSAYRAFNKELKRALGA